MTTTLDKADRILTLCHGTGITPQGIYIDGMRNEIRLNTCPDYKAICAAAKAKTDGGRLLNGPTRRMRDALAGDLLITHLCWPHLDCWGQKP